jgi:beta-mannosidase
VSVVREDAIDLGGTWQFGVSDHRVPGDPSSAEGLRAAGLTLYPATVPGNFELDLLANGLIDDPFVGMNIVALRRYESAWVYYTRTFEAPERAGTTPELVFEGLDCIADIWLNGRLVHHADNMLIEQRVAVAGSLRAGANELFVRIEPAVEHARTGGFPYPPGLNAEGSGFEGLYVRKAPHMYGWDIMPRAVSAGIWRPVRLRYLPFERLDWVWLDTERLAADLGEARLALHYQARIAADTAADYEIRYEGRSGVSSFSGRAPLLFEAGCTRFTFETPAVWWPRGRGRPDLYEVTVELLRHGVVVDTTTLTHGIRTVELDKSSVTTETGDGRFCFVVNGERIFVMGTNWVPLDAYHSRDADRIGPVLDLVEDIGCNMIRCWGGNVYEDDRFYDLCDRKGILVWQDFAMACAIYPQDPDFQGRIRAEATAVVRRLRQHPCLALWAGDNECDQKYIWGGRRRDPNENVLTRSVIPGVLADEDPSRPYLPSSPFIDPVAFLAGERYLPEDHLWGPRDYYKGQFYTSALAHFASEIGYHGCPEPASVRRFLSPDKVWPYGDNEEWLLHATSPIPGVNVHDYRVELMASQVRVLFGTVPDTLEEFAYASQASQAEALKFFIEMFRAAKWRRTGIIWWNIADGWPQFSDAVVDYYLVRKRAYDVVKRTQRPLSIVVREPASGTHELVACNDGRDPRAISFRVRDLDSGATVAEGRATAAGDAVTVLGSIPADLEQQRCFLLEWDDEEGHGLSHYLAGRPPFTLDRYRAWMDQVGSSSGV